MENISLFFTVLFTVFIAEMGDKTQLMLIAMTSKYKIRHICIGTAIAILVLNGLAVIAGGLLNEFLKSNLWIIKLIAAAAFFYFSVTSLQKEDDEEEAGESKFNFAPLAVFCTFFVAELGDKTQLTAITFGATNGLNPSSINIWIASSIGLFAADIIGMLIGYFLHGKTPDWLFKALAFIIFAVFGFINLPEGIRMLNEAKSLNLSILMVMIIVGVVFAAACGTILLLNKKSKK
ncbi:MAG: TMEM165/GDT1 family protein [Treponema sp.]|nr:TMEM165/GDT1 family protein [Candidatus Treponema equifaecale]